MAAELTGGRVGGGGGGGGSWRNYSRKFVKNGPSRILLFAVRASHSMDDKNTVYRQLGLFSLKKKIEDAVLKAEMLAPTALELEEEQWIKQEEMIRDCDLWDDPAKSNEILIKLADSAKAVDTLKDMKYKAEEVKLITQLAEMDAIDYGLFERAYDSSLDVSKSLHHYEMSKLLREPYDIEGACMIVKAGSDDAKSQMWAEQLLSMYTKWAEKLGRKARVVDKRLPLSSGINSAIIEFEFEYAYGYLLGEQGVHRLITSSQNRSTGDEESIAVVDIIPLFFRTAPDSQVKEEDLVVSYPSKDNQRIAEQIVRIQHIPTGVTIESSGERSQFANKIKALNRLTAKLLVIATEQGLSDVNRIRTEKIQQPWQRETRRYVSQPHKMVYDVKTGVEIPDLNSVLDGNIQPLIGAVIGMRRSSDAT